MTEERRTDSKKRDRIAAMEDHCDQGLEIVARLSTRVRWILVGVTVLLLGLGILSCQSQGTAAQSARTAKETKRLSAANAEAIRLIGRSFEKGCVLLANAIVAAGGGPARQDGRLSDQQRLTVLRLTVLSRSMTPSELAEQARLTKRLKGQGGLVIPDCKKLAADPDAILPVQQAPVAPPAPPSRRHGNP